MTVTSDSLSILQALPGAYLLLSPSLVIEAVSDAYLAISFTTREQLINQLLFEVFAAQFGTPEAATMDNLRASLEQVLTTGQPQQMPVQHYNLPDPAQPGTLVKRYWLPTNTPVLNAQGKVTGILHRVINITEQVLTAAKLEQSQARQQVLNQELQAIDAERQEAIDELRAANAKLVSTQYALQQLNEELEARVAARTQEARVARAEAEQQRARLERLFRQAPAMVNTQFGPDHVFDLVHPLTYQLLGNRPLVGLASRVALPELEGPFHELLDRVYQTGESFYGTAVHGRLDRHNNGELHDAYFDFTYQPIYDEAGQVEGIMTFAVEVTDQIEARQQTERQQQQLRTLFMEAPAPIVILEGPELVYQLVNPAYQRIFPGRTLLGRPVFEALPEVVGTPVGEALLQVYRTGETFVAQELPLELTRYEGGPLETIYWTFIYQARRDAAGAIDGVLVFAYEVTDQVQARRVVEASGREAQALAAELARTNQELQAANQQLVRINNDLDNFIYTASHDLKAPILNVESLLTTLAEELPTEQRAAGEVGYILELMQSSVERFKRTIEHLTDVSRLQQEYARPTTQVNLAEVVEDVRLDLAPLLQETGGQLDVRVYTCPPLAFSEKNLRSVVYNLLSNALKYHSPERTSRVQVGCHAEDAYVVLEVQDNGLGLDLASQQQLFQLFRRFHTHVEGTGVGLYMVKKMVENGGGRLEVSSHLGVGSTFTVYFPR